MRTTANIAASLLMLVAFNQTSNAQSAQCGERNAIVSQLASKHKEQQSVMGLSRDGRLLEIWSSYKSRSFTVLLTWPTMQSCIVAAGQGLEMTPPREFISRFEF